MLVNTRELRLKYFSYLLDVGPARDGPPIATGPFLGQKPCGARARRFLASGCKPRLPHGSAVNAPVSFPAKTRPRFVVGGFSVQDTIFEGTLNVQYRKVEGSADSYARNPRAHAESQIAKIAGQHRRYGWTNPILVDGDNGIIAGHGGRLAARKLGLDQVPVIELAPSDRRAKAGLVIADNRLALDAGWDDEMLALELADCPNRDTTSPDRLEDAEIDALLTSAVASRMMNQVRSRRA